ncbi:MAG: serine--tRNA ligase [Acidimicrobiales bacterium]
MIDVRRLRTELDAVKAALARKGVEPTEVERAAALDVRRRELAGRRDEARAGVKALSQQVGRARRDGDTAAADKLAAESRALGEEASALEAETAAVEAQLTDLLLRIPNTPAPEAPDGASAGDNVVVRVEGHDPDRFEPHQRVPHWEVGAQLGILDLEAGARVSGSMFVVYRGAGATLVRALCQLGLDRNADAFEEVRPPTLVRTDTLTATGQLPKFADDAYHLERDDLWAIPTAEVPLTSLGRDQVYDESALPVRLMAHTTCYRREAGSAGRDTRGLLRVHEFDKVEILAFTTPEQAEAMHRELLARAEGVLRGLGLGYRVVDICAGDLGQSHARAFDLEVYSPGVDQWLEVSSVSWFSDYQARRANIRYRPAGAGGTAFVHTLNGSALAVPRVWAAVVESNRRPDGSVRLPDVLAPYLRGRQVIPAPAG